ncbi:FAD-dependent oxidoreductase [Kitasatospora camelliae]|uniref:ferredoxin--NADP(+) reductase n=1 Tax=Kitasatospora camelliae TaxID=3156397 RepID=A0AAU8K4C2_9ACTN
MAPDPAARGTPPARLRVAVVGSGPAGLYTAEAVIKQAGAAGITAAVDVLDRLPTPYGLVRYGVAPDHPSIRGIADYLRRVLEHPSVRFLGDVCFGREVTRGMLLAGYDAVVYATGAPADRRLRVPGEELPGSTAAAEFVRWYCGHPDADPAAFTLDAEAVAVIGAGNVALDVARVLAAPPAAFRATDVPEPVLAALLASRVREVHVIIRRGPAEARFTPRELRELGEVPGIEVTVDPGAAGLDPDGVRAPDGLPDGVRSPDGVPVADGPVPDGVPVADRRVRQNLAVLREWAARPAPPRPSAARRVHLRFGWRPVAVLGTDRVTGLRIERTRPPRPGEDAHGPVGTGEFAELPVQLVLRSIGYRGVPLPGVPFDAVRGVVPHHEGRVLGPDGRPLPGEYVAGWLKRGPTGVIGSNKSDAAETVRSLLADLAGRPRGAGPTPAQEPGPPAAGLPERLAAAGVHPVSYREWLAIDAAEHDLAAALGRGERVKLRDWDALHQACGH